MGALLAWTSSRKSTYHLANERIATQTTLATFQSKEGLRESRRSQQPVLEPTASLHLVMRWRRCPIAKMTTASSSRRSGSPRACDNGMAVSCANPSRLVRVDDLVVPRARSETFPSNAWGPANAPEEIGLDIRMTYITYTERQLLNMLYSIQTTCISCYITAHTFSVF